MILSENYIFLTFYVAKKDFADLFYFTSLGVQRSFVIIMTDAHRWQRYGWVTFWPLPHPQQPLSSPLLTDVEDLRRDDLTCRMTKMTHIISVTSHSAPQIQVLTLKQVKLMSSQVSTKLLLTHSPPKQQRYYWLTDRLIDRFISWLISWRLVCLSSKRVRLKT